MFCGAHGRESDRPRHLSHSDRRAGGHGPPRKAAIPLPRRALVRGGGHVQDLAASRATAAPDRRRGRLLLALAVLAPLAVYAATISRSVAFDDSAEFAYCAVEWSVAHPPGFPAWTALAHLWVQVLAFLDPVLALSLFSAACGAVATGLLYLAAEAILARTTAAHLPRATVHWSAFLAATSAAFGMTVWQWANAIEVYALQLACTALVLLGIGRGGAGRAPLVLLGLGIGLGLGNHHLNMLVLAAALPWLGSAVWHCPVRTAMRRLLPAAGVALAVAVLCYGLLWWRATGDYRFEFGNPDSPGRLWHHLKGGFFGGGLLQEGVDRAGRAQVLATVVLRHYGLFLLPLALGLWHAWRSSRALAVGLLGPLAALLPLQLARSHIPNMDATLVPALSATAVLVAMGLPPLLRWRPAPALGVAAVALQALANFAACNRAGFDPGDGLLADLDRSAPRGSIVLIDNWDQRMIYDLHRALRGFREDLVVVDSSLKGTNHRNLPCAEPAFHAAVAEEYAAFLAAVAAVDPDYVYTDWYVIGTGELARTHRALVARVLEFARAEGRAVLLDRQAVAFLLEHGYLQQGEVHPHGNLFAVGRLPDGPPFAVSGRWLDHPFLLHDLCALATLENYATAAAQMAGYYRFTGQDALHRATAAAREHLERVRAHYRRGVPAPRAR